MTDLKVFTFALQGILERSIAGAISDATPDGAFLRFSTALVDFAKAMEVEAGRMVRAAIVGAPAPMRLANVDGASLDLARVHLSLGQLSRAIGGDKARLDRLAAPYGRWFVESLPPMLEALAQDRNPATHGQRLDPQRAIHWRDQILGIGKYGMLEEMSVCWGRK